jgi:hypothetical protein
VSRFVVSSLCFLSLVSCTRFQREIAIPRTCIQEMVGRQFPCERNILGQGFFLDSPIVYFSGKNIGLKFRYCESVSAAHPNPLFPNWRNGIAGAVDLNGMLACKQGWFFLSRARIVNMVVEEKDSSKKKGKRTGGRLDVAGSYRVCVPVYRLDSTSFKQRLARRFLRDTRIEGDSLIITLGL